MATLVLTCIFKELNASRLAISGLRDASRKSD